MFNVRCLFVIVSIESHVMSQLRAGVACLVDGDLVVQVPLQLRCLLTGRSPQGTLSLYMTRLRTSLCILALVLSVVSGEKWLILHQLAQQA
jgi:hypothetical protein